jgi:hypothetical protein
MLFDVVFSTFANSVYDVNISPHRPVDCLSKTVNIGIEVSKNVLKGAALTALKLGLLEISRIRDELLNANS